MFGKRRGRVNPIDGARTTALAHQRGCGDKISSERRGRRLHQMYMRNAVASRSSLSTAEQEKFLGPPSSSEMRTDVTTLPSTPRRPVDTYNNTTVTTAPLPRCRGNGTRNYNLDQSLKVLTSRVQRRMVKIFSFVSFWLTVTVRVFYWRRQKIPRAKRFD